MKPSYLFLFLFVIISFAVMGILIPGEKAPRKPGNTYTSVDYNLYWEKIDSLEQYGLPRSALNIVNKVFKLAKQDNNPDQLIKSMIYKMKFEYSFESTYYSKRILQLEKEAGSFSFPVAPVMYSMLGEMYWQYFQNNRYRFYNRSKTVKYVPDDLDTWDLDKILDKARGYYLLSINNAGKLQQSYLNSMYTEIIRETSGEIINSPTLYDFLMYRAIHFFSSEESSITRPAQQFKMDDRRFLSPAEEFMKTNLETPDSTDHNFLTVKLYQDLTRAHLHDKNSERFVETDLIRLNYMYSNSTIHGKESHYVKTLTGLREEFKNEKLLYGLIGSHLAKAYYYRAEFVSVTGNGEFIDDYKKSMEICKSILNSNFELPHYIKNNCNALISQIKQQQLNVTLEDAAIPAMAFPASIEYRNLGSVYIKIFKTSYRQMDSIVAIGNQKRRYSYSWNYNEYIVDTFKTFVPLKEFSIRLPKTDDYRPHITEIAMPELPPGQYVLLFSNNARFSSDKNAVLYNFLNVTNISFISRNNSPGGLEYYVFRRETGKPLAGITARAYSIQYNYRNRKSYTNELGIYTPDETGYFKIPVNHNNRNIIIDFIAGTDTFSTRNFGEYYSGQHTGWGRERNRNYTQTYFFTDRGIYRPGQTVYFKGIIFETDRKKNHKIMTGYATTVTFYDANHQDISHLNLRTSEYGTFSGSFIIPQGRMNGRMYIRNRHGSKYFLVEEYKRPKFEVTFNKTKGAYKVEEKVTVTGVAKAFSGAPVDGAGVKYRVVRNRQFFPRWYYFRPAEDNETAISSGTATTNEKGEFDISFTAIPDYSVSSETNPVYRFTVTADVTDINGETHSATKTVSVGYNALIIGVNIPDIVDKNEEKQFSITTTNLEGNFEPAKGKIVIYKLKNPQKAFRKRLWSKPDKYLYTEEEYHKLLPYDEYAGENDFTTWDKENKVAEVAFNTDKLKTFNLKNSKTWTSGKYTVEISSQDKYNQTVKETQYFTLYSKNDASVPSPVVDFFELPVKSAEPGESVHLLAGTSEEEITIVFELEQDGVVLDKKQIRLNNELQVIKIPIREEYRGNVSLNYVFVRKGRLYNHSETIRVPYTNKQLDITFETFRDRLQPGENEEWRIKIAGKQGDRVAAEMVATLYDASLDEFASNNFDLNLNRYWSPMLAWRSYKGFNISRANLVSNNWHSLFSFSEPAYPELNWFGFNYNYYPVFSTYTDIKEIQHGSVVVVSSKPGGNVVVSGTVKNLDGEVLPGASIQVLGTQTGTVTGADGKFKLEYKGKEATLVISYIGYLKESVKVKGITVLDIRMAEDVKGIDEVVVVGYGTQKKAYLTGSSASVEFGILEDNEDIEEEAFFETSNSAPPPPQVARGVKSEAFLNSKRKSAENPDLSTIEARTNFNETAFFYPHLQTNENGEIIIKFKIPESLTKWKMLGFAHTRDLKYGTVTNELVTSKNLMVVPNMPRFFREGDKITLSAKISNVSNKELSGSSQLMLFDAITMKPVDKLFGNNETIKKFSSNAGQSTTVSWTISVPKGIQAVTYRVVAKAEKFSDGEEMTVPVMTNRMLVTETMPVWVKSGETKEFGMEKLINHTSTTLSNHRLTFEFTANPVWYAIQALPYIMEYPYECMEQTFSRFYSNSIATHIVNSRPKIKQVFDTWRNDNESEELLSNLEKNQELKQLLLEETPWVLDAKNESERKKRVALLFDLNKMSNELGKALQKLKKGQYPSGGWPWFEGGQESRWITQYIVTGFGHLDKLGIQNVRQDREVWNMISKAIKYLDQQIMEDYARLKKRNSTDELKDNHLSYLAIHYLYGRSFFKDVEIPANVVEAVHYFKQQAEMYWLKNSRYMQGMIALALYRDGRDEAPMRIVRSLKEFASHSDEFGMYWNEPWGYYWYQAPVETQALMIEAFSEITDDKKAVDEMRIWLLKQKQTTEWKTTKATTKACYALLLQGTDWLASETKTIIKIGEHIIDPAKMSEVKVEAGTGYFKKSWTGSEITRDMGKVTLTKNDAGISWGGLYWQYFEDLDKITPHQTPLKLQKKLFREIDTDKGKAIEPVNENTLLNVGDKIIVRIELRVDRAMEYVHMKDMRAACFEPVNVVSKYKWQDGLGYYESTKDASVNFFFDWLPEGTYVFEYPLWVTHKGDFSNGITTIQCMYAPEFSSHSEGIRVRIGE